jgi:Na+-translocating ferredoxin:NAD+ oxidoreductase subunit D
MSTLPPPPPFVVTPGPHLRTGASTASIMWWVNAALLPTAAWGVYVFGPPALAVILFTVLGAAGAEALANRAMRQRSTVGDGSAVCTGLLLALTLPPLVPWWAAMIGGAFAILLGKSIFGGLGFNLFNPAMIGRAFMMASFPVAMTTGWSIPRAWYSRLEAITTATPLGVMREHDLGAALHLIGGPAGWFRLLIGLRPGSIGEVSVVLIVLGAAVLLARGIIHLAAPLGVFVGLAVMTSFSGAAWLHLLSGGVWLAALFMATDYVTSPNTRAGQFVFGAIIGLLTGLIRLWGGYPEGICFAILIANAMVPAIDMWLRPRRVATTGTPS